MRLTRTAALVFSAVTLAATAASPSPAGAFFFPIPLLLGLGQPPAVTVNPGRGPADGMGRVYTVKPGKASTGTRSRDEDSKPSKASTGTRSRDEDSKPSKASTGTRSRDDDGKSSSGSGKGAKSATKAEANANSGHGGRQTQRRSAEREPAASKSSGRVSTSVQRAGSSLDRGSDAAAQMLRSRALSESASTSAQMSDAASTPWPRELRLHNDRKALTIAFDNGETFDLSAEYLRVKSPSAEVQGHSPDEPKTVAGKKDVAILDVNPIGNYAVRLVFDDMHSTGIYSWDYFLALGRNREPYWQDYLDDLAGKGLQR
jgi:DUF971 family protein